jgi:hypothetical protein
MLPTRSLGNFPARDTQQLDVPDDLLDWTPLGESL